MAPGMRLSKHPYKFFSPSQNTLLLYILEQAVGPSVPQTFSFQGVKPNNKEK